tara:strand:+ start:6623 stop:7432 length:810 start_codon:yes stop_codon:yes gene_type:complete
MNTDFKILEDLKNSFIEALPTILGLLAFVIISWILLKLFLFLLKRFLKFSQLHLLNEKINGNEFLHTLNFKINLPVVIHKVVKWILVLIIVLIGSELFGLDRISDAVLSFLGYLPTLISAIVILTAGLYLASYLKETVKNLLKSFDLNGSNSISNIVFFVILVITVIISLNQLGVNTEIITSNLSIILGSILLAFTIAMGLGSKDVILRLILGFYTRKNLEIGKKIKIDTTVGSIISIDNICLVLQTDTSRIVYPIKTIVNKKIEILED